MPAQLNLTIFVAIALTAVSASQIHMDNQNLPLIPPLPETLVVHTTRHGLPWPLPDVQNSDGIMIHALHCLQIGQESSLAPEPSKLTRMHQRHCNLHNQMIRDHLSNSRLQVPLDVCRVLLPSGRLGKTNLEQLLGDSCCAPWAGESFRGNGGQTKDQVELGTGESIELRAPINMTVEIRSHLAAYNFGRLLIKSYEHTATSAELAWLEQWHHPLNVARGGMAHTCYTSHPEIRSQYQCLIDGVKCQGSDGGWNMTKSL